MQPSEHKYSDYKNNKANWHIRLLPLANKFIKMRLGIEDWRM